MRQFPAMHDTALRQDAAKKARIAAALRCGQLIREAFEMKKFVFAAAVGATLLGGVAHATPPQDAPTHGARAMAMLDTDKDGVVSRTEALSAADRHFARMDRNSDGVLTADELRGRHHKGHHRPGAPGADTKTPPPGAVTPLQTDRDGRVDKPARGAAAGRMDARMLARLDTDRNGSVSREEFRAAAAKRFDRTDTNRDGRIDAAERAAMQARMRERMSHRRGTNAAAPQNVQN